MSDPATHIFPTLHRDKHSKLVAFPVGAEVLSRLLEGVPQHALMTCSFYAGNPQRNQGKPIIQVLHLMYRKQGRSFFDSRTAGERGVFDPRWSVTVFSVPQHLRHEIRTALIDTELEETVRPWLLEHHHLTGKTGEYALVLEYDTLNKTFLRSTRGSVLPDTV